MRFAARRNLAGLCRWLLACGVDPSAADRNGRTALELADLEKSADAAQAIRAFVSLRDAERTKKLSAMRRRGVGRKS